MKKSAWTPSAALAGLVVYLSLWPVPLQPGELEGAHHTGLCRRTRAEQTVGQPTDHSAGDEEGREHLILARDGKLYAAVAAATSCA